MMAGDWIKMRADLLTHPKVVRISSALNTDTFRIIGGLMSVWCLFDTHSLDGRLDGYTLEVLDDHLRWTGFSAAMQSVGWLDFSLEIGLLIPRFDTHNGQSAKRRAQDADRKRDVRKLSALDADTKRTREEKRREDISTDVRKEQKERSKQARALTSTSKSLSPNEAFSRFWVQYPKKQAKVSAQKAFEKLDPNESLLNQILTSLEIQKKTEDWTKEGGKFIPFPTTWLNNSRWEDEIQDSAPTVRAPWEGAR